MTKSELAKKMVDFIVSQNVVKDEWYTTERSMATMVLTQFADQLGIDLDKYLTKE